MAMLRKLLSRDEPRDGLRGLNPAFPTRRQTCPHCQREFEAARRAVILKCPGCSRPLQFEDLLFRGAATQNLTTMGEVRVTRRGALTGRIDCGSLVVEGSLRGEVDVRGRVRIEARATIAGSLRAREIVIQPGAQMRGTLHIRPAAPAGADEQPTSGNAITSRQTLGATGRKVPP